MKTKFYGKKITGILTLLPETEYNFEEDMQYNNLSEKQNRKLQKTMGYDRHRIFKKDTYLSKVAIFGINNMIENNMINKEDISAIVLSTTSPDYLMPATSNLIMEGVGLDNDVFCIDTNQQCAGFTNGLLQAFMLLNNENMKKVLLITGDVMARNPDRSNTSSYPLSGDAICITVIENCDKNLPIYLHTVIDAKNYDALVFPGMGWREATQDEIKKFASEKYGGYDYLPCLHMDGQAVFQYVMQDVPKYINETLDFAQTSKDDLDYYFFHQPNKFMVDKLAQKIEVSNDKVPSNVVTFYGNSNSSTIPVCISHNIKDDVLKNNYKCMFAGFGAGLSYSGIIMELGKLDFCEMIITNY